MHWRIPPGSLDIQHPVVLGILNITPDSFSDGGFHLEPSAALAQAETLLNDGAAILDLGAESTRPGAGQISAAEEWERLQPVLACLRKTHPEALLSLDTRHAEVASNGLASGVAIINDVTGFSDPAMLRLAQKHPCGLIAMRSRIQDGQLVMPDYGSDQKATPDLAISEMKVIRDRLLSADIEPERIVLDPGFGFGTTFKEDEALWAALPRLSEVLAWPVQRFCLGISRKRFLAWRSGNPKLPPSQRDDLTRAAHLEAHSWGYRLFRTHALPNF
jgi:dihydropteroate synthase